MQLSDFDFDLPERLIATRPAKPRSSARLLVSEQDQITDASVTDITNWLRPGDRLVLNDTKVLPARLSGFRRRDGAQGSTEARIEATLLEPRAQGHWTALLKPLKKVRDGEVIHFSEDLSATVIRREAGQGVLEFNLTGDDFDTALAKAGAMPLPPYIAALRAPDEQDREDYQTIWAARPGAVAAPTASLHFDDALLDNIARMGVQITYVTLHVGAGTFLPVKVDDVTTHKMHAEWGEVSASAAAEINATRQAGGRVIPVGTTALRLIESAARDTAQHMAAAPAKGAPPDAATGGQAPQTPPAKGRAPVITQWQGETDIFIYPGFQFRVTDALMTNFHLPKSTLMMLVSALVGQSRIRQIYAHAVASDYRFFSYGDASLLIP